MFTTTEQVNVLTGYDVEVSDIHKAQAIIESYVGRLEVEVTNATDIMLLGRATAYQAAYMKDDPMKVFEQISVSQIGQYGATVSFKSGDVVSPWIAPLAVIACQRLTWKRIRSVRTGSIWDRPTDESRWTTE